MINNHNNNNSNNNTCTYPCTYICTKKHFLGIEKRGRVVGEKGWVAGITVRVHDTLFPLHSSLVQYYCAIPGLKLIIINFYQERSLLCQFSQSLFFSNYCLSIFCAKKVVSISDNLFIFFKLKLSKNPLREMGQHIQVQFFFKSKKQI